MPREITFMLVCLFISCAPRISYLGDEFGPTKNIDTYYDELDINRDYRVMGLMSANNNNNTLNDLNDIKDKMIEEAQKKGADAVLFLNLYSDATTTSDRHIVEAKLLKYK